MNELEKYLSEKNETRFILPKSTLESRKFSGNRSTHILLLFPPITIPRYMQKRCMPPLGISYIAAYLERLGYTITILDCCVEGYEDETITDNVVTYGLTGERLANRLRQISKPDVIGVSVPFSNDIIITTSIMKIARTVFPDAITVMGGLHPTIYPRDINLLDGHKAIDYIIRGEGAEDIIFFGVPQGWPDRSGS